MERIPLDNTKSWWPQIRDAVTPKPKEPVIFSTLYGSRLYGTFGPDSDVDVRGVFLPSKKDLLLGKAPKQYSLDCYVGDNKVDCQYLSLQYFLELLTQGETNCLDMFFSFSNKDARICDSPAYEELRANADKIITKNVTKYLGYCKSQALKYFIKGDRIQALENFQTFLRIYPGPYLLSDVLDASGKVPKEALCVWPHSEEYLKNNKRIGVRHKVADTGFGDHVYVLICDNKEKYLMVSDHKFPLNANINSTMESVRKCLESYGKRAYNAAQDNGADYKALSHALRVAWQAKELLETGSITFPRDPGELEILKAVKYKTTTMSYDEIVSTIEFAIKELEEHILPATTLPSKPDMEWIQSFILKQYEEPNE